MKKLLPLLFLVSTLCALPVLRGQELSPAFTPPPGDPIAILAMPAGMDQSKVSVAVSKALVEEQWENLGWERNVTTATTVQSKITIKVYAVATAADVKFYANFTSDKEVPEDKFKRLAQRQIGYLEKTIATKLNLSFKKAKGDSMVDQAVGD
ncbi:MAG: hypothetical protein QM715_12200 [Nibricoccus sp.]